MGYVEAWKKSTDKKLQEKHIYAVEIDYRWEEDMQLVYTTKLEIDSGRLIVTNEKGDRYSLVLKTL